jgi:hypothetical protein
VAGARCKVQGAGKVLGAGVLRARSSTLQTIIVAGSFAVR